MVCGTRVGVLVLCRYGVVANVFKIGRTPFPARFSPPPAAARPGLPCGSMRKTGPGALRSGWGTPRKERWREEK
jgi:hypothetical protein